MEKWKRNITAGNECFNNNQLISALAHYQCAKSRAKQLLGNWFNAEQAVAAVVISYHNLADLYHREGYFKLEQRELRDVYLFVLSALENSTSGKVSTDSPDGEHQALVRAAMRCRQSLMRHCKRYPDLVPEQEEVQVSLPQLLASACH